MKRILGIICITVLSCLLLTGCQNKQKAGLYDKDNQLVMSWEELLNEGIITVTNGVMESGFYETEYEIGNTYSNELSGKLVIEEGVTEIAYSGLRYCYNLEEIILPESLEVIGRYAFQNCTNLTGLKLPANLREFGNFSVENDFLFMGYQVDPKNETFKEVDGVLFSKDGATLVSYPSGIETSDFDIPKDVTTIHTGAFCLNIYVETLRIPKSVKSIEASAFYGCVNMAQIAYQGTEDEWNQIEKGNDWDYYCQAEIRTKD